MKFFVSTTCLCLLVGSVLAVSVQDSLNATPQENGNNFTECLEADSISCLQMTMFRKAKSLFENPQIEVMGGVSLVKTSNDGRQSKSLDNSALAVEAAPTVEARNIEISNYLVDNVKKFFAERSLTFNFAGAARSMARAIPDDIKADLRELVVESRGKKKKLMKKLLPIMLGVGAKLAILTFGSLFGLFFIAKKALIVSVIAFFLSLVGAGGSLGSLGGSGSSGLLGGLGGLFGGKSSSHGSSNGAWSSGGGWSSGGAAGWDAHGSYSSPAQNLAYSAYKANRR